VHSRHRVADALQEARPPGADQRGVLRIACGQLGGGVGEVAAGVVLEMPVVGDDVAQERIERLTRGDETLVQDPRIPMVEDAADIEDDGRRADIVYPGTPPNSARRGLAQPWRALNRRLVLLMT
jgi:hypothetical protein